MASYRRLARRHTGGAVAPAKSKLHADIASEAARCRNHAGLDFDFLRLAVHLLDDAIDLRQNRWNVGDDQRIGAFVGHHVAALAQEFLNRNQYVFGMRVAEEPGDADFVDRKRLGIDLRAPVFGFPLERVHGGDAQNIAIQLPGQIVVLEHDVQRLIPRHVIEYDGQVAVDLGVEHDVQSADLVNQAEEILQVYILKVDRDGLAGIFGSARRGLLFQLRLLLGGQVHSRSDGLRVAGRLPHGGISVAGDQISSRLVGKTTRGCLRLGEGSAACSLA